MLFVLLAIEKYSMNSTQIILLIAAYFGLLILISYFTGKNDSNEDFFKAGKQSPVAQLRQRSLNKSIGSWWRTDRQHSG